MSILEQLMKELGQVQQKHTQPTIYHNNPTVHGENALFGVLGAERDVISSRVDSTGLAGMLPAIGTVDLYPLYPYLVGRDAATGSQPTEKCDDAPTAGAFRSGFRTAKFGAYQFESRNLDITRSAQLLNRGETADLRFVNDPLARELGNSIFANMVGGDQQSMLRLGSEFLMRQVEIGQDFHQVLSVDTYTGAGTGNTIFGLESLVSASQYDAITGSVLTSLASDIRDFGDVDVTTTAGAVAIVNTIVDAYRFAKQKAATMRMTGVTWSLVCRPQLYNYLVDLWPSSMMTFGAIARNANVAINISADASLQLAQEMRMGSYLWIDGDRVPVVQDMWMPEDQLGANQFASDIYLLPMSARGTRTLFWEYFDYSQGTAQAIRDSQTANFFWSDQGKYLWTVKPPKNWCVMAQAIIEPRLTLLTPQFASRISNCAYTIDQHWYDGNTASSYYVGDDGSSYFLPPSYYGQDGNLV